MWKTSLSLLVLIVLPVAAHADGGMQKVAEGKYIVNVSSAPIAPYVGDTQKLLIGFANIQGELIEENIGVDVLLKINGSAVREEFNLTAKNGVLPLSHTYAEPGIYELYVKFRLPNEPEHTYMPEDFLIEAKMKERTSSILLLAILFGGIAIGFLLKLSFPLFP